MRENIYTWALLARLLYDTWPDQRAERKDILADSVCNLQWQWSHYCQQDSAQLAKATSQRTQLDTRQGQNTTSETARCHFERGWGVQVRRWFTAALTRTIAPRTRRWHETTAGMIEFGISGTISFYQTVVFILFMSNLNQVFFLCFVKEENFNADSFIFLFSVESVYVFFLY